jgi:hypothetical protein
MKTLVCLTLVLVIMLAAAGTASADFSGPFYDTWVQVGGANNPTSGIWVQDSTGNCTDTQIAYIQFAANTIGTVTSASLTLTEGSTEIGLDNIDVNGVPFHPTLSLYGVADFDPDTLSGTNAPRTTAPGVVKIQSILLTGSAFAKGNKLVWGGADTGLMDYVQAQARADKIVTLAMSFSANCNPSNSQITLFHQEYTVDPSFRPVLDIKASAPTAVTMSTFRATDPAVNWPLIAGLGALAAVVIGGLAVARRRAAPH